MSVSLSDVVDAILSDDATEFDRSWQDDDAEVTRVVGGHSGNSVYRISLMSQTACLKVFEDGSVAIPRPEGAVFGPTGTDHEWDMLNALQDESIPCVPEPLFRSGENGKALVMTWCEGEGLGNIALNAGQVAALARALRTFGNAPINRFPPAGNFKVHVVGRAKELWRDALADERMVTEFSHLKDPVTYLFQHPGVGALMEPGTLWLGRGDPNLANALWWNEEVSFIDFEHSGYNDRSIELADLAEHPQSHACDDEVWEALWDHLELDDSERERILYARYIFSVFWFGIFLTNDFAKTLNPPQRVSEQAVRMARLFQTLK